MQNQNSGRDLGEFQIINETDSIIRGAGEYSGHKRSRGEAGLDSESDNESRSSYTTGVMGSGGPKPGKKTRGRVKIEMKFIENKLRRYTTFSKRKTGIMKKAYELSTLTGTQVMLLVASETGHVYTFATRKLQPMITSETGKALIQTCLNSPDGASSPQLQGSADQRMNVSGYEETDISNYAADDEQNTIHNAQESKKEQSTDVNNSKGYVIETGQPAASMTTSLSGGSDPSNSVSKLFVTSDGLTSLVGAPKLEKQDNVAALSLGNTTYLLGAAEAVQMDEAGTQVPASTQQPVAKLPHLTPLTTLPAEVMQSQDQTQQQQPEYTDLKPALNVAQSNASATVIPQATLAEISPQVLAQLVQQQQIQQPHVFRNSGTPVQSAIQVASQPTTGLAYLPTSVSTTANTQVGGTGGALVYQTPTGMVYAPSTGETAGLMLSLPQTAALGVQTSTNQTGATTQYITIPVPVPGGQTQIIQVPIQQQPVVDRNQIPKSSANQTTA